MLSCYVCRTDGSTDTTTDDSVTATRRPESLERNSAQFSSKGSLSDSVRQTTELNVDTYKARHWSLL